VRKGIVTLAGQRQAGYFSVGSIGPPPRPPPVRRPVIVGWVFSWPIQRACRLSSPPWPGRPRRSSRRVSGGR